jgi:hypothetical protein
MGTFGWYKHRIEDGAKLLILRGCFDVGANPFLGTIFLFPWTPLRRNPRVGAISVTDGVTIWPVA